MQKIINKKLLAIVFFIGLAGLCSANQNGKTLHFPKDRSLGYIKILDTTINRQFQTYHLKTPIGYLNWNDWMRAENFSQARGDVIIPPGKKAALFLNKNAFRDLSPLENLRPDDLHMLSYRQTSWNDKIKLTKDNALHISHLTGLKELRLFAITTLTESMKHLIKLPSLEMLDLPKGMTNKDLLYVTQMKSLKRLYFTENRITNFYLIL